MGGLYLGTVLVCATSCLLFIGDVNSQTCIYEGKEYQAEQSFELPCMSCVCDGYNGPEDFSCIPGQCDVPNCVDPIYDPANCCDVCPNGENCYGPDGTSILSKGQQLSTTDGKTCECQMSDHQELSVVCT